MEEIPAISDVAQELEEALRSFMDGQKRFMLIKRQPRTQLAGPLVNVLGPLLTATNNRKYGPLFHCSRFQSETALLNETYRELNWHPHNTVEFARHVALELGEPQKMIRDGGGGGSSGLIPVVIYNRIWCRRSYDELGEFCAIATAYQLTLRSPVKVIFIMESISRGVIDIIEDDGDRDDWFMYRPTKGLRGMKLGDILPCSSKNDK